MQTFKVTLLMRAECEDDARELLEDYMGNETHIKVVKMEKKRGDI